jgi:hypothetical protein
MKTKSLTVLFVVMFFSSILQSQTLSPTVISSAGGFYTSANVMLSFTVAEMTIVKTFTSTGNILTQGFQQPESMSVDIQETTVIPGDILIYPNPTNGNFTLTYTSKSNQENTIKMYNLVGQMVFTKNVSQLAGTNTVTFDISSYSQGIYILELNTLNSKGEKQTTYSKINLVY